MSEMRLGVVKRINTVKRFALGGTRWGYLNLYAVSITKDDALVGGVRLMFTKMQLQFRK